MRTLSTLTLGILLTAGGIGIPLIATADPSPGWEHGRMHEGSMMHDSDQRYEGWHGGMRGSHDSWKASLSDKQQKDIDKLRLTYKRGKYLLKAKMKQAKVEFALLITKDNPGKSEINSKIDQITKLKSEMLHLKADYKTSVRKLLTEEQRVKFDFAVLAKAAEDRHGKGRY